MKLRYLMILIAITLMPLGLFARQVGNIDKDDNTIERVTVTYDGQLIAWDKKGYMLEGWPVKLEGREFILAPGLFDVDMDEKRDVLTIAETEGGAQEFRVFNGSGQELNYLNFNIIPGGARVTGVPIMIDVTGDGLYEISYGLTSGTIQILRPDFVPLGTFNGLNVGGHPVVYAKDTNNDGMAELFANNETRIYRWDSPDVRAELFSAAGDTAIKGDISFFDLDFDRQYEVLFATTDNRIHIIDYAGTPVLDVELDGERMVGPPVPADVDLDGEWEVLVPTNAQKLRAFEVDYLISKKAADPSYKAGADGYVASWGYTISYRGSNLPTIDTVADDLYIGSFLSTLGYDQSIVYRSKIGYSALQYGEFAHQYDLLAPLQLVDFVKITDIISHPAVFTPNGDGVNDTVKISYRLNMPAEISLVITDLRHHPLATVIEGVAQSGGENHLVWDGILPDGNPAATGNYIGRIKARNADGVITTANANLIVNGIKAQIEKPYDPNVEDAVYPKVYGIISIEGVAIDPNIGEGNDNADFISYSLYYKRGVGKVTGQEAVEAGNALKWMPLLVPMVNQCVKDEYYLGKDAKYPFSNVSCRAVQHGLLGYFDTKKVPNGFYTILLKTMDSNGNDPLRISYDAVSVHVQNPSEDLPYDASNPFSMNNPDNPIYNDPAIDASVDMSGPTMSDSNPAIDITFSVDETSDVQIVIHKTDETCSEVGPVVFIKEFGRATRDEYINFEWDGTTPLGRRVTGGWYKMKIVATAVDGSGYNMMDSKCFEVEMGFASSDILEIDKFESTPYDLMLADDIDIKGEPEHVSIYYEFSKHANATIQIFDANPMEHLDDLAWIDNHSIKLIVKDKFSLNGAYAWYGEKAGGSLATDLEKAYALLTAESVDQGNYDKKYALIEIPIIQPQKNGQVTASVTKLVGRKKGSAFETVTKDSNNRNLEGDPSFYWLAWGKGRVELDLEYYFYGTSDGQRFAPCNSPREYVPLYACAPPNVCYGKKDCDAPPPHALTGYTELDVSSQCQIEEFGVKIEGGGVILEDMSFWPEYIKKERKILNPECKYDSPYTGHTNTCQIICKNGKCYRPTPTITQTAHLKVYPKLEDANLLNWTRSGNDLNSPALGYKTMRMMRYRQGDPEDPKADQPARLEYRARIFGVDGNYEQVSSQWCTPTGKTIPNCASDPNLDEDPFNDVDESGNLKWDQPQAGLLTILNLNPGYHGVEYQCGKMSAYYRGRKRTSCWFSTTPGTPDSEVISSSSTGGIEVGSFEHSLEGCNWYADQYIPGSTTNRRYVAYIKTEANGNWSGYYNIGEGTTNIKGLIQAWRDISEPIIRLYAKVPFHPYWTNQHDPYLGQSYNAAKAPDRKIRGFVGDFNDVEFSWYTPYYNIFDTYKSQGYITNPYLGYNLHSFSDAVRIEDWYFEFRYPNESDESEELENGELLQGIFEPVDISIHDSGETETCIVGSCSREKHPVSNNILDKFRLKLLPNAVPKRFVNIYGSADKNYKLYYFDSDETEPKWVKIPSRKKNAAVSNGVLGAWDVTTLNGENYTVVLRAPDPSDPGKFNQDYISVGIGQLAEAGQYARVFTPFKRASLIFDSNTLTGVNKDLITINQVKLDSADFEIPNGIMPLGPIFDIKPDDIQIDPNFPVELNFVFTKDELKEMFDIDKEDYSKITIYNLREDNVLEPIATLRLENCSHPDPENYGIHDGCLKPENDKIRFTGLLNHFSSYVIVKAGPIIPKLASPLIYPRPAGWDEIDADPELKKPVENYTYNQTVHFEGTLEDSGGNPATPQTLSVKYYPKGNEAAISASVYSNTDPDLAFDFDTQSLNLNGEYILRFKTRTEDGIENSLELPMLIDNMPPTSTLRFNGTDVVGNQVHMVNVYSVVEIVASDLFGNAATSGIEKVTYRFNQGEWKVYEGPFTLVHLGVGPAGIEFKAMDKAGNEEDARSFSLLIVDVNQQPGNAALPQVNINTDGPVYSDGHQTWVSSETEFSLEAENDDYDRLEYQTEEGEFQTYEDGFTLDQEEGFYVIDYFATDEFGARGERYSERVIVDNTPPVSTYEFEGHHLVTDKDIFVEEETSLTLRAVDGGLVPSGVKRIEYKFDDGEWVTYQAPLSFDKTRVLYIRSIDNVDNYESSPEGDECAHRLSIRCDDVIPSTSVVDATKAFSPNGDGIKDEAVFKVYNSDNFARKIYITLVLINQDSQEKYTLIDKEEDELGEYEFVWDGTVGGKILPEGRYAYNLTIRDEEGNMSKIEKGEIVLDVTPPSVSLVGSSKRLFSPNEDGQAEVLQIDYELEDNLLNQSIKAGLIVFVDNTEIYRLIKTMNVPPYQKSLVWNGLNAQNNDMPDGKYSYTIYAEDTAGNKSNEVFSETTVQGDVAIDRTPPVSDIDVTGNSFITDDGAIWLGAGARVGFVTFDPMPGTGVDFITYALDDSLAQYYVLPFEITDSGAHTIGFGAVDRIGNREATRTVQANVDLTPPESSISLEGVYANDPELGFTVSRNTTVIVDSVDSGVGVSGKYVMLAGRPFTASYDEVINLVDLEEGAYTIQYWADDLVGNVEPVKTMDIYYDARPPKTRLIIGDPSYKAGDLIYIDKITPIRLEVDSNRGDVKSAYYQVDNGTEKNAEQFTISGEGAHTITYYSQDQLANVEQKKSEKVYVDGSTPSTAVKFSNAVNEGGIYYVTDDVLIDLEALDEGSGVSRTEYQWDGQATYSFYLSPLSLPDQHPGLHSLTFRSADNLGHVEAAQTVTTSTQGLALERHNQVVPRTLVIMVQAIDLRETDPRPNEDILDEVLNSIDGFYKIMSTDKCSFSDIINEMTSGIYNIYIVATDAHALRWDDRKEVDALLSMLKAHVHMGKSLITILGGSQSEGKLWEAFLADIMGNLRDGYYGRGSVAEVGGNPGVAGDRGGEKQMLEEVVKASVPAPHQPHKGEIIDVQLAMTNRADYPVSAKIEILGDETILARESLPQSVAINSGEKGTFNYLVRLRKDNNQHRLEEDVFATWKNGLEYRKNMEKEEVSLSDGVEDKITKLYDKLYYEQDSTLVKVASLLGELYYALHNAEIEVEQKIWWLLEALKEIGGDEQYGEIRYELENILGLLGTDLIMNTEDKTVVNYSDGPIANLGDDTTQYAGEGGCSLIKVKEGSVATKLIIMVLILSLMVVIRTRKIAR